MSQEVLIASVLFIIISGCTGSESPLATVIPDNGNETAASEDYVTTVGDYSDTSGIDISYPGNDVDGGIPMKELQSILESSFGPDSENYKMIKNGTALSDLVIKRMRRSSRFNGAFVVITCHFSPYGFRIFCQERVIRPPPPPPQAAYFNPLWPNWPGFCCRPKKHRRSTTTTPSTTTQFDTELVNPEYDVYTGTGTGEYTGGEAEENGRLHSISKEQEDLMSMPPKRQEAPKRPKINQGKQEGTNLKKTSASSVAPGQPKGNSTETNKKKKEQGNNYRAIRSLRHKDVVVSFDEWRKKHSQGETHQK